MTVPGSDDATTRYMIRIADDLMINAQRLAEYMTSAPELEEELAIANVALDNLGVAQTLFGYVAGLDGSLGSADDLAFLRTEREYTNCLLVEQPHVDFADVMVRQFFFDAWHMELWPALAGSQDETLAAVAQKAAKEARYHFRHSSSWIIRLGDGTPESHSRVQRAVDALWRFTGELTAGDNIDEAATACGVGVDPAFLATAWTNRVTRILEEATLDHPADPYQASGGRRGLHTEHLGHLLAEMQFMQRAYPEMSW